MIVLMIAAVTVLKSIRQGGLSQHEIQAVLTRFYSVVGAALVAAIGAGLYAAYQKLSGAHSLTLINCVMAPARRVDALELLPRQRNPMLSLLSEECDRNRHALPQVWAWLWSRKKHHSLFHEMLRSDSILSTEILEELLMMPKTARPVLRILSQAGWECVRPAQEDEQGEGARRLRHRACVHPETRIVLSLLALRQHGQEGLDVRPLARMALLAKSKKTRELGIQILSQSRSSAQA